MAKTLAKNEFTIRNTLTFPDLIKNLSNFDEYEDVSYDVEFLFTSIPVEETINYIINQICIQKEIEPIFKKLLLKLRKECMHSPNGKLLKQLIVAPQVSQYQWSFQIYRCVKWNLMLNLI